MTERAAPAGPPQNLVLITIDAWRADFVDQHAGVRLTPNLDRVARRTVRFDGLYANGPWTSPALVSVFSGEPVDEHGVDYVWSAPRPGSPGLVTNLLDAGWAAPNLCYLNRLDNYTNLGFSPADTPEPPRGPSDPCLLQALDAVADSSAPFFLWFHYKYVHLPYWPARRFREQLGVADVPRDVAAHLHDAVGTRFIAPRHEVRLGPRRPGDRGEDKEIVQRLYAAAVLDMDAWLGTVLDALERHPARDRTTLVLTSDHGEELLDHDHVGHASTAEHATLFEEVLRIPLLVVDPRVSAPRRLDGRLQGLDLFPTLHSLAGLQPPPSSGVDLAPAILAGAELADLPGWSPDRLFSWRSARRGCPTPEAERTHLVAAVSDGRHKAVRETWTDSEALYDLRTDPHEQHPITDPAAVVPWQTALDDTLRSALDSAQPQAQPQDTP